MKSSFHSCGLAYFARESSLISGFFFICCEVSCFPSVMLILSICLFLMLFLRLPSVCLLLFLHSLSPLVSPPSILHTHPIFNCWNCKYSLYEKVKLNHNHSEVIMKLVFKPVCLFSEARPACRKLLWGTECSMLFCDCLPVPGSSLSAPLL